MAAPGPFEALLSLCVGIGLYGIPVGALVWVIILLRRIEARLTAIEGSMKSRAE